MRITIFIITVIAISIHSSTAWCQRKQARKPTITLADSLYAAGQFTTAIPIYQSLLKEASSRANPATWNKLALSQLNLQHYAEAAESFNEVYRYNKRFPGIFLNRAKAYAGAGNIDQSIQMLDSAAIIGRFGNYIVLESDPSFENLRKDPRYKEIHDRVAANALPCMNLPEAHQFDFWLGEWDVYQTSDLRIKTGFNHITRKAGDCIILESWESVGPHRGMSLNYFDPVAKSWKQKWVGSSQDITEFYDGKFENNAMQFKWDAPNPNGSISPGRLTFTNLAPGRVRQHSEQSSDGGKTWQTVYDFTYIRRN